MAMTSCTSKGTFSNGKVPCIPFSAAFLPKLLFSAIRHSHDRTSQPPLPTRRSLGGRSWSTTGTKQTSSQRLLSWRISFCVTNILFATTRFQRESCRVYSKSNSALFHRLPKTRHVPNGCRIFNLQLNLSMSTWTIICGLSITCLQCKSNNLKSLFFRLLHSIDKSRFGTECIVVDSWGRRSRTIDNIASYLRNAEQK